MRPPVDWEMIPVPEESMPPDPSSAEFLGRPARSAPDVIGRFPENGVPEPEIPEFAR